MYSCDLALPLALGGLVDRELDLSRRRPAITFDISAEYSVEMSSSEKWIISVIPKTHALVVLDPVVHAAELHVADDVVDVRETDAPAGACRSTTPTRTPAA